MSKEDDLDDLKQALPYLRTLTALCIYMRYGLQGADIAKSYDMADKFIKQLRDDVGAA